MTYGGIVPLPLASRLGRVVSGRMGPRATLSAAGDTNPLRAHGGSVNESQAVRLGEVGQLLRTVAISTVLIEFVVGLLIYPSVLAKYGWLEALWVSPMYAAMAFTNTGFTLNEGGIAVFQNDYAFMTVIMLAVIVGSVGFPLIFALSRHLLRSEERRVVKEFISRWSPSH